MNFNPACAASQRLPQPGHRGGTGLGEDEAGWGRTNCELPLPESRRRRGQTRPLAPSEREARESRARLARRCAPGPGRAARSPRCPFGRGQLPAAAVQPPCAPAQVTRGTPCPPPGGCPGTRSLTDPRPPARGKLPSSQAPGSVGWQAAHSPGFPGLRLQAPSPGSASFLPAPHQPRAPGGRRAIPAPPLQQSRRPGGDPARGWEWRRGRHSPAKAPLCRASEA